MKDIKGLTVIEILIVVSIISILLMITFLNSSFLTVFREKEELVEFKKDLEYARNRAIVESAIYSIKMDIDENCYLVSNYTNFGRNIIKKKEFVNGIKLIRTNIFDDEIIFGYSGAPRISGTIYLENRKGEKIEIRVLPVTGKVNIELLSENR